MTLTRSLGLFDVFSICSGAMISSGIFLLPSVAFRMTGPSMIAAYLVAAFLMIPTALVKAELATAMPISGLTFYSVFRSLGPYFGCVCGFASWLSITFKTAFAAMGLGGLYTVFYPNASQTTISMVAIICTTLFVVLNMFTVNGTKSVQKFLVAALLIILSVFSIAGLKELPDNADNFTPFLAEGWTVFFATVGTVSVAYGGLTKIVAVSEEIKRPQKNIPKGIFLSFFSILFLYVLILIVVITSLTPEELASSFTPVADAADRAFGKWASIAINIASFTAYATTLNSGVLSSARSPVAMSRDNILPKFLGYTSAKFKTPIAGLVATWFIIVATLSGLDVEGLAKVASAQFLLSNLLVLAAGIIFRYSRFAVYQPSIKMFAFPFLNITGILVNIFLLIDMGSVSYLSISVMLAILVLWHFAYVRTRTGDSQSIITFLKSHPSATSRSIVEDELLAIKTTDLKPDHFDEIAERSLVIDSTATSSRQAFNECADAIEERWNLDALETCNKLVESEFKGGFDIAAKIAVFNVAVCEKPDFLELVILRSKAGVKFYDGSVCKMVYVFISAREFSSNFLQCFNSLSKSIARKDFLKHALTVRTPRNLQELFFVCARKRYYYSGTNDVVLETGKQNPVIDAYSRRSSVCSSDSALERITSKNDLPALVESDAEEDSPEDH
ncbi:hypothetical protein GEMRC1_011598 [Eukaryota sp. GEM-RC1]